MVEIIERLHKHPLTSDVLEAVTPIVTRDLNDTEKKLKIPPERPPKLTALEKYIIQIFESITRILNSFEMLRHSRTYLATFTNKKKYKEAGINKGSYLQYHYSYHSIISASILDIVLILINRAFYLGLPDKLCRLDIIKNNFWVNSAGVGESLNELNKALEPIKRIRNLVVHRGHERKYEIESFLDLVLDMSDRGWLTDVSQSHVRKLENIRTKSIQAELEEQEEALIDIIYDLFTKIHPIYDAWVNIFQKEIISIK